MRRSIALSAFAVALVLGAAAASSAEDVTVEMHRLGPKGVGAAIGSIVLTDGVDGVNVKMMLKELTPGPNRFRLFAGADCNQARGDSEARDFATLNVDTDEDGSLPLKSNLVLKGVTMADLRGNALVVSHGSQVASSKGVIGVNSQRACGVVP
jgi:Cu/Zn superoxide dismutase